MRPDMCPGGGLFTGDGKEERPVETVSKTVAKELLRNREFEIVDYSDDMDCRRIQIECLSLNFDISLSVTKADIVKLMNGHDLLEVI